MTNLPTIKAVLFDLDGTLIQTEVLKADSYAMAIAELTQGAVEKKQVLDIFNQFVGLSRTEVVQGLSKYYYKELSTHLSEFTLENIGKKLIEKRLALYREVLENIALLSKHFCRNTLGLFHRLYRENYTLVLATMSHLPEAKKVTEAIGIYDKFDLILTRDDVENGKPAPDIYNKAKEHFGLSSEQCLVIEDSPNGIMAAQNAGMPVFAVTNSITRASVHHCNLLDPSFIIDDLTQLETVVCGFLESRTD